MRKTLLFLFFCAGLYAQAFTQNTDWRKKIDPKLWEYAQRPDSAVEFMVIMQKQADISAAKRLRKKEEKGKYVFETLSAFAEKDQRNLRDVLQNLDVPRHSYWIINAVWAKGTAKLIETLAQMPEVGKLRYNPVLRLKLPDPETENIPASDRALSWGLTKINADDVWNLGHTGAGIVVGGQDTGYEWEHPAIANKYRGAGGDHDYNWHDAIRALIAGGPAVNSCGLDLDHPCDDHDHGTHTMGTMVGNDGTDNIGVAPDATWIGCRNMEEGAGTPATYIECFEWFVAPTDLNDAGADPSKAPHVINNSWGCPEFEGCNALNFPEMEAVVQNVRASGIVVVVSAGNDGPGCESLNTPAAIYDASFTVGATNNVDIIANFSSRGPVSVYTEIMKPDISAPGVAIRSCKGHDNNAGSFGYVSWDGTSMAGPHVAGAVALLLSARPDLIGNVDEVEDLLRFNAVARFATAPFCGDDLASSHPNNVYGWGRLDALAAVNAALPVELLEFTAKKSGEQASLSWITGSERECDRFVIQSSADGYQWKNIGALSCRGNETPGETRYDFMDKNPHKGLNYYRLAQYDFSGAWELSPVRVLSFARSGYNLKIRSGAGLAYFEVIGEDADEQAWQLELRASDGRVLQHLTVGHKGWLNLPDAPPGLYTVWLQDAEGHAVAVEKWLWVR